VIIQPLYVKCTATDRHNPEYTVLSEHSPGSNGPHDQDPTALYHEVLTSALRYPKV